MSSSSDPPNIQATFGPLLIGLILSMGLQGILVMQTHMYWKTTCIRGSLRFKHLVFGLCALELFHCAVSAHAAYWYLILNYNRPLELERLIWSSEVELALTVLITFIGRGFWIVWLFILSRENWWIVSITSAFSLVQLGLGIAEIYESVHKPYFNTILGWKPAIILQMLSADLGDTIISIALCHYLHASRSGTRRTDLFVNRLLSFTVTRGILVIGSGTLQLISYVVFPETFIFGAFHLIASKLYTNAFLATLNSRDSPTSSTAEPLEATNRSFVLTSLMNDRQINNVFEPKTRIYTGSTGTVHLAPTSQHYCPSDHVSSFISVSSIPSIPSVVCYDAKGHTGLIIGHRCRCHDAENEIPVAP